MRKNALPEFGPGDTVVVVPTTCGALAGGPRAGGTTTCDPMRGDTTTGGPRKGRPRKRNSRDAGAPK